MYSAITNTFFESKDVYLGYAEAAAGLGLMVGPILGGGVYTYFASVKICYIVLALIILVDVVFTIIILP